MSLHTYCYSFASEYDVYITELPKIGLNYLNFLINNRKGFYRHETQSKIPSAQNIPYGI